MRYIGFVARDRGNLAEGAMEREEGLQRIRSGVAWRLSARCGEKLLCEGCMN